MLIIFENSRFWKTKAKIILRWIFREEEWISNEIIYFNYKGYLFFRSWLIIMLEIFNDLILEYNNIEVSFLQNFYNL